MLTLSSIRKVQEILSRDEFSLYDKRKGDHEKKYALTKIGSILFLDIKEKYDGHQIMYRF